MKRQLDADEFEESLNLDNFHKQSGIKSEKE